MTTLLDHEWAVEDYLDSVEGDAFMTADEVEDLEEWEAGEDLAEVYPEEVYGALED